MTKDFARGASVAQPAAVPSENRRKDCLYRSADSIVARYDANEGSTKRPLRIHPRRLLAEVIELIRGHDQMLIRAGDELPWVVASYPRGRLGFATSLQSALSSTSPSLTPSLHPLPPFRRGELNQYLKILRIR